MRERLRWEKELLGLYLSEHPMGEVAEQVGQFVNAYSGDLRDESLDGQRDRGRRDRHRDPDRGHQAQGRRWRSSTIEDLQGTIEVVVFPRLYETTRGRPGATARSCSSPVGSTIAARRSSLLADLVRGLGRRRRAAARRRSPARSPRATAASRGRPGNGRGGNGTGTPAATGRHVRWSPVGPGAAPATRRRGAGASHRARPPLASPSSRRSGRRRGRVSRAGAISALPPIAPAEPVRPTSKRPAWRPSRRDRDQEPLGAGRGARADRRRGDRGRPARRRARRGPPRAVRSDRPGSDRVVSAMERSRRCSATAPARRGS